jgi:hypothetical protein
VYIWDGQEKTKGKKRRNISKRKKKVETRVHHLMEGVQLEAAQVCMPEKGKTLALMPLIKTIYRRKAFFFFVCFFFSMTRNGSTLVCHGCKGSRPDVDERHQESEVTCLGTKKKQKITPKKRQMTRK